MNNKEPVYVYILTNPSFHEDWVKIGKSIYSVDIRKVRKNQEPVTMISTSGLEHARE